MGLPERARENNNNKGDQNNGCNDHQKKVVSVFNHVESVHKFELIEVTAIIYRDGIDGAPEIVNIDMVQNCIAIS